MGRTWSLRWDGCMWRSKLILEDAKDPGYSYFSVRGVYLEDS